MTEAPVFGGYSQPAPLPDGSPMPTEDNPTSVAHPRSVPSTTLGNVSLSSLLDEVREDAKEGLSRIKTYEVSTRPRYKVSFDVNISKDDFDLWQKQSTPRAARRARGGGTDQANMLHLAARCLIASCTGVYRDDQQLHDSEGEPILLNSKEWLDIWLGENHQPDAIAALRKFMGDGTAQSMGLAVLMEAGYSDGTDLTVEDGEPDENPTRG